MHRSDGQLSFFSQTNWRLSGLSLASWLKWLSCLSSSLSLKRKATGSPTPKRMTAKRGQLNFHAAITLSFVLWRLLPISTFKVIILFVLLFTVPLKRRNQKEYAIVEMQIIQSLKVWHIEEVLSNIFQSL